MHAVKPNDYIKQIGSEADNEKYHNELMQLAFSKIHSVLSGTPKYPVVQLKTGHAAKILKTVNTMLINTTSMAWVQGALADLEQIERDAVDHPVIKAFVDARLHFYHSQAAVLEENIEILHLEMAKLQNKKADEPA